MPDLTRMLTEAFPTAEPGFDAHDVRGRVQAAGRRRRRVAVATMSAVVVLLVLTVATIGSRTMRPADFADFVPLSQWPDSVDFAGVEVSIEVLEEPTEPMESRVTCGAPDGTPDEESNGQNNVWDLAAAIDRSAPLRVPSAQADISLAGEPLTVTAGGVGQIVRHRPIVPAGVIRRGGGLHHRLQHHGQDQTGADLARDLVDSIVKHPDCARGSGFDPPTPYPIRPRGRRTRRSHEA